MTRRGVGRGRARAGRALANLIDRLDEAQALARLEGRAWVTEVEWRRIFAARTGPSGDAEAEERHADAGKKSRRRAKRVLRSLGLDLVQELVEDPDTGRSVVRVVVLAPPLVALVQERLEWARGLLCGDDPDEPGPPADGDLIDARDVRANYRGISERSGTDGLRARFGIGWGRLVKLLGPALSRRRGRRPVEETRPPRLVAEARAKALARASVAELARLLRCSWEAARGFARRVWREARDAL